MSTRRPVMGRVVGGRRGVGGRGGIGFGVDIVVMVVVWVWGLLDVGEVK